MKKLSITLFFISIILLFLSITPDLTGAVTTPNKIIHNSLFFYIALTLFFVSILLFVSGKTLEAIVIPTGPEEVDKKRVKSAMRSYTHRKEKPYVLITGEIHRDSRGRPKKDAQQYQIYKQLRDEYDLKPSDMIIEGKSTDTLENFLYSLKKIKKHDINEMKISTNRTQYWRFKMFEEAAKKEGILPDNFKVDPLYTEESTPEFLYGVLAYVKDYVRLKSAGTLKSAQDKKTGLVGNLFKNVLNEKEQANEK